ncbi:hypothetical protein BH09PSE4_BH09PSE4_20710 [soil metagenome]
MGFRRICAASTLAGGAAALVLFTLSAPAAAQEQAPCTTKSECDARQEAIDAKNRREAWDASVKREQDYAAQRAQLRAQAKADANNGRISRAQAIMHRRHVAAEAQGN